MAETGSSGKHFIQNCIVSFPLWVKMLLGRTVFEQNRPDKKGFKYISSTPSSTYFYLLQNLFIQKKSSHHLLITI